MSHGSKERSQFNKDGSVYDVPRGGLRSKFRSVIAGPRGAKAKRSGRRAHEGASS